MSYQANVYQVFIASPGDVATEREIIRKTIAEWNFAHAQARKIFLEAVGWETHSVPEMGDHPQEIVNEQILESADLLIAVFWHRLGTATGSHLSGTVEEIEKHLAASKPAMIYFSEVGVKLGDVDQNQYRALQEFRSVLEKRGLIETYGDLEKFAAKLKRQLDRKLNDESIFKGASDFFLAAPHSLGADLDPIKSVGISAAAIDLLRKASNRDGIILTLTKSDGSLHLQVGNEENEVIDTSTPRLGAKWRSAIEELYDKGFLRDINGEHEIFELTSSAYTLCDSLKPSEEVEVQTATKAIVATQFPDLRLNLQYFVGKSWLTGDPSDPRNNKWTVQWEKLLLFITNVGASVSISDVSFSVNGKKVNAQLGPLLPQFVETNHTLPGQEYLLGPGALANLPGMNPKIVVETSCGHTVEFDPKLFYEMKPMHGSDVVQLPQPPASTERSEPEQRAS